MKAVVCTSYGDPEVLELTDVAKPVPRSNQVCIRIHATAVTASDCIVRGFKLPRWSLLGFTMGLAMGFSRPRQPILGMVLAGEVESMGKGVTRFKQGDRVFGMTGLSFATYAQYKCMSQAECLSKIPTGVSYEEAAAAPYGAMLAGHFLKKGGVQNRKKVLIYGASGAVGTTAVQLAKHHGAEVTGVCSTANVELVRSLGADSVLDYTKQDSLSAGEKYDLVFDAVGEKKNSKLKQECREALTSGGKYISVDHGHPKSLTEHLDDVSELMRAGTYKAVIDRTYPLGEIVEAHRYVDKGHKKGNVIITVLDCSESAT